MRRARILAALALGAAVLIPATAHADLATHADALGDVRELTGAMPPGPGETVAERREGDIRAIRVNHLPQRIVVSLTFRELSPKLDGVSYQHRIDIRFQTGSLTRDVLFVPGPVTGGHLVVRNGAGRIVSCAARARADYPANVVTLELARACVGEPPWVRVGARSTSIARDSGTAYLDDARATGVYATPVLGPRIAL